MIEKAYAKINLFLDVTGKRNDGFHEIRSIMQTVSVFDELHITFTESKEVCVDIDIIIGDELGALGISADYVGAPKDNLIYRAAMRYMDKAGITAGVSVKLIKNIPVAAGLAGGSADAAAILRAMNKKFESFSTKELCDLASEIGSDVPFCIEGGTALCTGRGEQTVRLSYTPELDIVIAIGNARISTPKAYAALDKVFSDFDGSVKSHGADVLREGLTGANATKCLKEHLLPEKESEGCIYNIFENSDLPELYEVEKLKNYLREYGATATLMSGSGPSVFGIFDSKSKAEFAISKMKEKGIFAVYSQTVRY